MEWLQQADAKLFHLINNDLSHSALNTFFVAITNLHHQKIFMWGVVPAVLMGWWWFKRSHAIKVLVVMGLVAGLCDALSYRGLKPAFARPRPHQLAALQAREGLPSNGALAPVVRVPYWPKSYSFPSNHALTGFALARLITWYHPTAHIWAWLVVGLVAYSRVYVGVHYPGDVVGGALIGWLIATLLIKWVITRFYFLLPIYGYKSSRKMWVPPNS
ncbi:MAG: phosphatase PAP2 family protein [Bdellovibrionales bacterium]|nr:phosphatase PAP2 family protein [Bdellovibrionales bacterium]